MSMFRKKPHPEPATPTVLSIENVQWSLPLYGRPDGISRIEFDSPALLTAQVGEEITLKISRVVREVVES